MYTYTNWTELRPQSYNYNYLIDSESDSSTVVKCSLHVSVVAGLNVKKM